MRTSLLLIKNQKREEVSSWSTHTHSRFWEKHGLMDFLVYGNDESRCADMFVGKSYISVAGNARLWHTITTGSTIFRREWNSWLVSKHHFVRLAPYRYFHIFILVGSYEDESGYEYLEKLGNYRLLFGQTIKSQIRQFIWATHGTEFPRLNCRLVNFCKRFYSFL